MCGVCVNGAVMGRGSSPRFPGYVFLILMLYNLVKIAQGMLAYSPFLKSPRLFQREAMQKTRIESYKMLHV